MDVHKVGLMVSFSRLDDAVDNQGSNIGNGESDNGKIAGSCSLNDFRCMAGVVAV